MPTLVKVLPDIYSGTPFTAKLYGFVMIDGPNDTKKLHGVIHTKTMGFEYVDANLIQIME